MIIAGFAILFLLLLLWLQSKASELIKSETRALYSHISFLQNELAEAEADIKYLLSSEDEFAYTHDEVIGGRR